MKKFLLIVFMLLLVVPVKGLENDNIKYKYYRLNKVMGPLVFKGETNEEFPFIYEENPIKSELSEFLGERPLEKEGREIYEYDGYHYLKIPKIDSIEILMGPNYTISDVDIMTVNGNIEFKSDNDGYLSNGDRGNFYLNEGVNLEDLIMQVTTGKDGDFHSFAVYFKSEGNIVSELSVSVISNFTTNIYGTQSVLDTGRLESVYFPSKQDDVNLMYKGECMIYQFFDYKYQSYKLEREYYPEYLSAPIGEYIYRDDNDYIIETPTQSESTLEDSNESLNNLENTDNVHTLIKNFSEAKSVKKKTENEVSNENKKSTFKDEVSSEKKSIKPKQYQSVLKLNNNKDISNNKTNKTYIYFMIVILIILLLLMLRIRNKLKNEYR